MPGGSTSTVNRHLKNMHPVELGQTQKQRKISDIFPSQIVYPNQSI